METKKMKKTIKETLKKATKRWFWMIVVMALLILFSGSLFSKKQIMNNLDYNITLNEDGSATIVETWDVYISHTNTLFRTFERSNKYGNIINVNVKDLDTGENLTEIYEEMYHVTTGCFYALQLNSKDFEVAWGTGMENKMGRKRYEFSYTVTDAVTSYKDCQEFYWMLLASDNSIPVKNVTGRVKMPYKVDNIKNLRAWGHGPLDGNIEITSEDEIKFSVKKLSKNKMLEIRAVTNEKQFLSSETKEKEYNYLDSILKEEDNWNNEANSNSKIFWIITAAIYLAMLVINIIKAIKYYKISKNKNDGIIHRRLKYFREIPRESESTPGEAAYLYYFKKDMINMQINQSDIVAANILNLALKKYIEIRMEKSEIYIKIIKEQDGLKQDELAVYKILKETGKESEFKINEINKFAKKRYNEYSLLINKLVNESRENLYKLKLVDKAKEKEYKKSESARVKYSILRGTLEFIILGIIVGIIPIVNIAYIYMFGIRFIPDLITVLFVLLPIITSLLIKLKMCDKTKTKIAVLTQEGTREREEWIALAKYIEEFSMIDEKEVPSLVIWEKYFVYATAFGIADRALEQMKAKYPEVFVEEYWKDENLEKYQIVRFATNNIIYNISGNTPINKISCCTETAYKTSLSEIAKHQSSGGSGSSGGGGGFSGGGGGRRWRRPEWEEDNSNCRGRPSCLSAKLE